VAIFGPRANLLMNATLIGAVGLGACLLLAIWVVPVIGYNTQERFAPEQPIPFSHNHHVSGLGLDCRYCHTMVEKSSSAGMPSTAICMTCHSQVWTNAAIRCAGPASTPCRTTFSSITAFTSRKASDAPSATGRSATWI
jgi:hypothetical protein